MVGVPGRSKGCHTCRKRRIGCSLERPQCSQCVKSNRLCGGYQRERIWVPNNQVRFEAVTPIKPIEDVSNKKKPEQKSAYPATLPVTSKHSQAYTGVSAVVVPMLSSSVSQHRVLQERLLSEYISSYVPESEYQTPGIRNSEKSWLLLFNSLDTLIPALSTSLLAVSTATLGRLHDNDALIMESKRLYGRGLRELQLALWNPKLMYSDYTLAACLALSLYEVVECPQRSGKGWVTHSNGCLRLVELRGPAAHKEGLGHQLFLSCRFNSVMQALPTNRTNFLSKPDWMSIPWSGKLSKTLTDRLEDNFVTGTAVLEAGAYLGSLKTTEYLIPALKVVESCLKIEADLRQIYQELKDSTPSPLFWPNFSTLDNPADDAELGKVFPVAYHFPSLGVVHKCTLYWSLCIILWGGMGSLYGALAAMEPELNPSLINTDINENSAETCSCTTLIHVCGQHAAHFSISALPPLKDHDVIGAVRNICQSYEYCMRPEMRGFGPAIVSFPLQIAIGTLKAIPGMEREVAWAKEAIDKINERGFRILKYAEDIQ